MVFRSNHQEGGFRADRHRGLDTAKVRDQVFVNLDRHGVASKSKHFWVPGRGQHRIESEAEQVQPLPDSQVRMATFQRKGSE